MRWYVKKQIENNDCIFIDYSYEKNDTCDGLLKYDKDSKNITIEKMSDGADEFATKWLFSHIHGLLRRNELNEKIRMVAIG
jgi:hypothetical protein